MFLELNTTFKKMKNRGIFYYKVKIIKIRFSRIDGSTLKIKITIPP